MIWPIEQPSYKYIYYKEFSTSGTETTGTITKLSNYKPSEGTDVKYVEVDKDKLPRIKFDTSDSRQFYFIYLDTYINAGDTIVLSGNGGSKTIVSISPRTVCVECDDADCDKSFVGRFKNALLDYISDYLEKYPQPYSSLSSHLPYWLTAKAGSKIRGTEISFGNQYHIDGNTEAKNLPFFLSEEFTKIYNGIIDKTLCELRQDLFRKYDIASHISFKVEGGKLSIDDPSALSGYYTGCKWRTTETEEWTSSDEGFVFGDNDTVMCGVNFSIHAKDSQDSNFSIHAKDSQDSNFSIHAKDSEVSPGSYPIAIIYEVSITKNENSEFVITTTVKEIKCSNI